MPTDSPSRKALTASRPHHTLNKGSGRAPTKETAMSIAAKMLPRSKLRLAARLVTGMPAVSLPVIGAAYQEEDKESAEQEVVIKREVLKLTDPRTYRVSMHLEAVRALDLTAPVDGYVRTVTAKPGQK